MKNALNIRFGHIDDLTSIVNIYNQAVRSKEATGDLKEFEVQDRVQWFNKFEEEKYPLYVAEFNQQVVGYASLSPYRPGRAAMASVAEISYYVDYSFHGKGIASSLIAQAINDCPRIEKKYLLAILLDINIKSIQLLEKFQFEQWGHLPEIIQLEDRICGHSIYGLKLVD